MPFAVFFGDLNQPAWEGNRDIFRCSVKSDFRHGRNSFKKMIGIHLKNVLQMAGRIQMDGPPETEPTKTLMKGGLT